jgi:hypothetical protein
MNLEKPEVETVGWIIVTLWKTWNEAWKARNRRFKEEDRYTAQNAKMQRTIDINIIYHCREYLPDELNGQLKSNVEEHLSQSDASIDEWLLMFRSIMHQNVIKKNKRAWQETEKHYLNLFTNFKKKLKTRKTRLKVRSLGLVEIYFTLQPTWEKGSN